MTAPQPSSSGKKIILGIAAVGLFIAVLNGFWSVQASNRVAESGSQSPLTSSTSATTTSSTPTTSTNATDKPSSSQKENTTTTTTEPKNPSGASPNSRDDSHGESAQQIPSQPTSTTNSGRDNYGYDYGNSEENSDTDSISSQQPTEGPSSAPSSSIRPTLNADGPTSPPEDPYLPPFSRLTEEMDRPEITEVPRWSDLTDALEDTMENFKPQRPTSTWTPTRLVNPKDQEIEQDKTTPLAEEQKTEGGNSQEPTDADETGKHNTIADGDTTNETTAEDTQPRPNTV